MSFSNPTILGLKKSFGFGDRLGLAGPGHIAALKKSSFAGIISQQSIREMARTQRTPDEVMNAARTAIEACKYDQPWGADADHLKTEEDVKYTADAGFCFFTIDPSEFVVNEADSVDEPALNEGVAALVNGGVFDGPDWEERYLGKEIEINDGFALTFDKESLYRAAVKYARAIAHCEEMSGYIAKHSADRPFEIEVSVDETDSPTSHLEHLFFALELKRRGVTVVSLAPRFIGEFEKGIDYKGDLEAFDASLEKHVAIAKAMGPYKISVHSGSDKFSIYPAIGRICGDLLHVKTAGTSYLEALRVVTRTNPDLFKEIVAYSAGRFTTDKVSYHISVTDADVEGFVANPPSDYEKVFLDEDHGRQLLHVTFGSVLTMGKAASGQLFKEAIMENLEANADLHAEVLEKHLGKHLSLLEQG
ncbi:tagaturonate epimerase family protein [Rubellicoccus peritrichatus]|uniref:Tagaturonate/fructuronate epimerase n=1 Tax=Rubellicoccus peritrichatus TaxID=3080537 RepID=A0AAQ3QWU4_9BACT|nr:tagaturonate epimerase family protein [Puniceicoccus sp. CR14]WOO43083.1 tagaturonate epimerase family protein [Puniceicoccus sp. CR14]